MDINEFFLRYGHMMDEVPINPSSTVEPSKDRILDLLDLAYVTGVMNTGGLEAVLGELNRIKALGKKPHDIFKAQLPPQFFEMYQYPNLLFDPEGERRSVNVILLTADEPPVADIGFFDFDEGEWVHFGDEDFEYVTWTYVPKP